MTPANAESVDEQFQRMDKQLKKLEDANESDTKIIDAIHSCD